MATLLEGTTIGGNVALHAGNTGFTQTVTSGNEIGTIKINDISQKIYVPKTLSNTRVSVADYPYGFSGRRDSSKFGPEVGSFVTDWHFTESSNSGDILFRADCPSSGQLSVIIDGLFYQNEGKYMCLDTNNHSDYTRKVVFVGSDKENTSGWYKLISQTMSTHVNTNITFMLTSTYGYYYSGIFELQMRSETSSEAIQCKAAKWLSRIGFAKDCIRITISEMSWAMYIKLDQTQYGRICAEILSESTRSAKSQPYTDYDYTFVDNDTVETTAPTATVTSSDGGIVAEAGKVSNALTINNITYDGSAKQTFNLLPANGGTITGDLNITGTATIDDNTILHAGNYTNYKDFTSFKGDIVSSDEDTPAKWQSLGSGVSYYSGNGSLSIASAETISAIKDGTFNGRPTYYGLLCNFSSRYVSTGGAEVHQLWMTQSNGSIYHRGGNANGFGSTGWKELLDTDNWSNSITSVKSATYATDDDDGVTIADHFDTVEKSISSLDNTKADIASPTFTGEPKSTTPDAGDNSIRIATTEFVTTAISSKADSTKLNGVAATYTYDATTGVLVLSKISW